MHTHYDNLKVTRGAPPEVIRAAYKALTQRYHPDRNDSPDAPRIMRLINEAYAVLGDPERRKAYDRELAASERRAAQARQVQAGAAEKIAEPRSGATAAPFSAPNKAGPATGEPGTGRPVPAKRTRPLLKWLFGIACAILVGAALLVNANRQNRSAQTVASMAPASWSWANPVTKANAVIAGFWKLSVTRTADGQSVYTFTEASGQAAVVFADEDRPELGWSKYIPAYIRNNAATMPLAAPGKRETVDGHEAWSADGHLAGNADVKTHVALRYIGGSFWRVVSVQAPPYADTDGAVRTLEGQLWGTLGGL